MGPTGKSQKIYLIFILRNFLKTLMYTYFFETFFDNLKKSVCRIYCSCYTILLLYLRSCVLVSTAEESVRLERRVPTL